MASSRLATPPPSHLNVAPTSLKPSMTCCIPPGQSAATPAFTTPCCWLCICCRYEADCGGDYDDDQGGDDDDDDHDDCDDVDEKGGGVL